jgi:hypothetical protein
MYFECGLLLTCIPYKLIDRGRIQCTLNSVVKEVALARIDSISYHFELLVSDYLHAGVHLVQLLHLVDAEIEITSLTPWS